ncbi:hypothetical protein [Mycoplasma hafezii]|uniref:hypothetical protein n=1 Tax=Mycoplasma hafezii TaxID=525886 RepID=UPI003CEBD16D
MNKLIQALEKKIASDKKKLKIYRFVDTFTSILIAILNISIIALAIRTLVLLVEASNKNKQDKDIFSFTILIILSVLILSSFLITITLTIYKYNSRQQEYKKLSNTIKYLEMKYEAGELTDEQLDELADKILAKASKKTKLIITKAIKDQITTGA